MAARYNATIQELIDIQNESAKLTEERCIERVATWLENQGICEIPEDARRLAESILSGDTEALADE